MEYEITEHDLEQMRLSALAECPPVDELKAGIVLARAGQATPPGLYTRVGNRWLPVDRTPPTE